MLMMERAKEIAEKYDIPYVFKNYQEMFVEVDAVCICTPNKFHAEITIAAFEAGVHVICEKPMALNAKECEDMIEASQKADKVLAIAYHYRFMKEAMRRKSRWKKSAGHLWLEFKHYDAAKYQAGVCLQIKTFKVGEA